MSMSRDDILANPLNRRYDYVMYEPAFVDFYDNTDFANHGYWDEHTKTASQACQNLVEKLLEFIPRPQGRILDVACGKGEPTRCLLKHYVPSQITAINISEKQLATARPKVPGADFRLMDATALDFPADSFDAVICVEAAFHFNTRRDFLREAIRVLKPGGYLLLADILATREAERSRTFRHEANFLAGPDQYHRMMRDVGFSDVHIIDATEPCWRNYFRYVTRLYHDRYLARQITFERLQEIMAVNYSQVPDLEYYLLVAGSKGPHRIESVALN
ncbi:MAG: class I SAM-dependent methyltransferase [Pirellulales bacterium]|nr:class I SAM-dependent methyltransferase [Pirellulales bacterium]